MFEYFRSGLPALEFAWQSSMFLVVGALASAWLWRRPARAPLVLVLAMFVSRGALPLNIAARSLGWGLLSSRNENVAATGSVPVPPVPQASVSPAMLISPAPVQSPLPGPLAVEPARAGRWGISLGRVAIALWAAITVVLLAWLGLSLGAGLRMVGRAKPLDHERILQGAEVARRRLGLRAVPRVLTSGEAACPLIWCWGTRPVLIVPAPHLNRESLDWPSILTHELAHSKRRDHLAQLAGEVAVCLLPWNPLAWWSRTRLADLSELACDDWVIASGLHAATYAESLVGMIPQRRSPAVLAAVSHRIGLIDRVARILDDRRRIAAAGPAWTATVVALAVTASSLTALARTKTDSASDQPRTSQSGVAPDSGTRKTPAASPASKASPDPQAAIAKQQQQPNIIIAEHVVLWENQIVTWEQVVERLRVIRKSGPFHARFYTTNGLSNRKDGWQNYHDRIMKLYAELFQPVGVTFASISPRGSARFDAIRTADDLRPDPKRARAGQVVTPMGEPARDAQVIVLPTKVIPYAALDIALAGTQMRDPFDEEWSPTDEKGHFVVYPKDDAYRLVILHPSGVVMQAGSDKNVALKLQPWATLSFRSTGEVVDQHADVTIRPAGLKPDEPGFKIYSIQTKGKPVEVKVPAGEVLVSRSLEMGQGTSISLPVETFSLRPGEARTMELTPPSDADRKRSRELYEELNPPRKKSLERR
jgi:beta-lactamase regulating signal transducer with metallopeptidase domain